MLALSLKRLGLVLEMIAFVPKRVGLVLEKFVLVLVVAGGAKLKCPGSVIIYNFLFS